MWSIEFLDGNVFNEMQGQPNDIKAKFEHVVNLIQANGLERVHEPYIKHLEGKLWEMRMKGRDNIARAIYVTAFEKRIVIVRVFTKKQQKTPRREIKIALERAKEIL
jgi:phage-related protein